MVMVVSGSHSHPRDRLWPCHQGLSGGMETKAEGSGAGAV